MKKWMIVCTAATLLFAACNDEKKETAVAETAEKKSVPMPYTATYSTAFEMGNPEYTATILQGSWKDWEENKLDNMKNWMADTIVALDRKSVV